MSSKKSFYTDQKNYFRARWNYLEELNLENVSHLYSRLEPKTKTKDFQKALSFEVFDPLWSLARQWQFGRFDGNDCGTPVSVKIKAVKKRFNQVCLKSENGDVENRSYSTDTPLEYEVEKLDAEITPYICVQSAMQFKKRLRREFDSATFSKIHEWLMNEFCCEDFYKHQSVNNTIETLKIKNNTALKEFSTAYTRRAFDGYKLYLMMDLNKYAVEKKISDKFPSLKTKLMGLLQEYVSWFDTKYFPHKKTENCWSNQKLGYQVEIHQGSTKYDAEDYDNGRLSWYSFDNKNLNFVKRKNSEVNRSSSGFGKIPTEGHILGYVSGGKNISSEFLTQKDSPKDVEEKMFSYIPVPANFTGAPSLKLWEFENTKVNMVADNEKDFDMLATAAILQYISMYSNDWMIVPLETETGVVLDVEGVVVKDSFGELLYMKEDAEDVDGNKDSDEFTDRWNLFGTASAKAFAKDNFTTARGLLFPPVVQKCEESSPIEEVQFLRDEMANMVWGVETKINDGCGGTMDGKTLSDAVFRDVDEENAKNEETLIENALTKKTEEANKTEAEYSLLIQNRVPLNWIPFLPEQLDDFHNIHFRRGRMPLFYNKEFLPVRPSTKLLAAERDRKGHVKPFYIDENQISGYGTKLVKTAQRTRWFLGETFNWIGNRTIISDYQANSGLLFDELIPAKQRKTIELNDGKEKSESKE
ncbi:hypothetical protein [Fibrobacter sp.]|uniref:hypothetical protein n=1 Tax=Fibrobacter sp. TaxID=35828 RepID=UPI00388E3FEC